MDTYKGNNHPNGNELILSLFFLIWIFPSAFDHLPFFEKCTPKSFAQV